MSKELKRGERLSNAFRRIAKKEVEDVIEQLAGRKTAGEAEAIHEARKELKKVCALLRLMRDGLGRKIFRRESRRFRAVGKAMARQRDAQVLVKTVDKLRKRHRGSRARAVFSKMGKVSVERLDQVLRQWRGRRKKKLTGKLKDARRDIRKWRLKKLGLADLWRGSARAYRKGVDAFGEAGETRATQDLHEWRKRVKNSWHQLLVIMPIQPKELCGKARRLKRLGECLGDDHDLAMLEQAAMTAGLDYRELEMLSGWLQSERDALQHEAFELGRSVYADKPELFKRRIKRYAKDWRRGCAASGNFYKTR